MAPVRANTKGNSKKKLSTWQYLLYGGVFMALLVGVSVVLPQVDTSAEREAAGARNLGSLSPQGSASQAKAMASDPVVDGEWLVWP